MLSSYEDHYACEKDGCPTRVQLSEASGERRELVRLQKLNTALYSLYSERRENDADFYYATYDRSEVPETARPLDGDFFWVRRIGDALVVVFGDAEGHYAYAGGVKMFVAFSLARMGDEYQRAGTQPDAADILKSLASDFLALAKNYGEVTGDSLSDGGIDVVVLVLRLDGASTFAAAVSSEMPMYLQGAKARARLQKIKLFGGTEADDEVAKAITFSGDLPRARARPLDTESLSRVVLMTDGFESIERRNDAEASAAQLTRGELRRFVWEACVAAGDDGAKAVVNGIVAAMNAWRQGYDIEPDTDDDRLVLVIDVRKAMDLLAESPEPLNILQG